MGILEPEWITANLIDLMGAYWWIALGTVVCTAAILSGLVSPIAQRLEEARLTLAVQATRRYR